MMMGFGLIGLLLMLAFWGVLIAGAVWLVKTIFPDKSITELHRRGSAGAKDILDQRYARGEITREEYHRMVQDLAENNVS
jgi:putative membrane protein